jgi:anti-sigma regulatory factor (Ser/Thr protein kinase)
VRHYREMESLTARVALPPSPSTLLIIDEQTQIGAARRCAVELGRSHSLSADAVGRLAIAVTEAATNIIRHAGRGVMVLRALLSESNPAIEVLALDKGPGIPDVARAMRDGFSTSGTAGHGLGGMQRLADVFAIYSQPDKGTALVARIGNRPRSSERAPHPVSLDDRLGVVCVPLRGETECGDAWRIVVGRQRVSVLLVDGLGHGPEAAATAAIAAEMFRRVASEAPEAALLALSEAMRGSRGAALSVAVIDQAARVTRFSGVGNVDGRVIALAGTEHLTPQNGIVGHTMPAARCVNVFWPVGARLVMHSDGITTRWRLDAYPGLIAAHPALVAGVIYRDFGRERDDCTVLVLADGPAMEER